MKKTASKKKVSDKTKHLNYLVKMICANEGGKVQMNAGQARQVIKVFAKIHISDLGFALAYSLYTKEVGK